MRRKILILEDDRLFAQTLEDFLDEDGFDVTLTHHPNDAIEQTFAHNFDLYLFDVNLPQMSGIELFKRLKDATDTTATIFLTSSKEKASFMEAYAYGCKDYIRKPFDLDELSVKIRALLKEYNSDQVTIGEYLFDNISLTLSKENTHIHLSNKARTLLALFIAHQGALVSKEMIIDRLWSHAEEYSEGSLRVYISELKKLFKDKLINQRGLGYRFEL